MKSLNSVEPIEHDPTKEKQSHKSDTKKCGVQIIQHDDDETWCISIFGISSCKDSANLGSDTKFSGVVSHLMASCMESDCWKINKLRAWSFWRFFTGHHQLSYKSWVLNKITSKMIPLNSRSINTPLAPSFGGGLNRCWTLNLYNETSHHLDLLGSGNNKGGYKFFLPSFCSFSSSSFSEQQQFQAEAAIRVIGQEWEVM